MLRRWRHRARCRALARRCRQDTLSEYLAACAALDVDTLANTPIISVDLELTGLDAANDRIIALGWTHIDRGRIGFASHRHLLVNADQPVGHSATIHELTDTEVAGGMPLETGLQQLFEAGRGRLWLFHHAGLDVAFLKQACVSWAGTAPPFLVLDTMEMELAMRQRRNVSVAHGSLQLSALRDEYHLPRYTAHNALIDACATAELLLAIASGMDPSGPLKLVSHVRFY
jgi:DNA polymerase-3 subunit epsilon